MPMMFVAKISFKRLQKDEQKNVYYNQKVVGSIPTLAIDCKQW